MPLELGVWRIDKNLQPVEAVSLDLESRLEAIISQDISIVDPNWMIIGRQVRTGFDKRIDLLAMDVEGNLIVLELKRDKTYRDIVAQVLDYGSWVRNLRDEDIARIFSEYQKQFFPNEAEPSINDAFCKHFNVKTMSEELNAEHSLVIVSSTFDDSTERIVNYLAEEYGVLINAVFFRVFKDDEREYLTRAWLREPSAAPEPVGAEHDWNGEYYVSFGHGDFRNWDDAIRYGFISAGGGSWYTRTLGMLSPSDRVWVNVPQRGYVGVGVVRDAPIPIDAFEIIDENGQKRNITEMSSAAARAKAEWSGEKNERFVRIDWLQTVPLADAVKERGFFGNQNTVARPRTASWDHTVNRLKARFAVS